jgi:hypothetical protein
MSISRATRPPIDLIEDIRQHKPEVISALSSGRAQMADVISPARWVVATGERLLPRAFFRDAAPRGLVERRSGLFLHFCAECGRWGTYGYGTTGAKPGRWYCQMRRPEE